MKSKTQLKLLIIQQSPDWGGAEEWMSLLIHQLIDSHQVEIIGVTNFPRLKKQWQDSGAEVIHLPIVLDVIGNWKGLVKSIMYLPSACWFYCKLLKQARNKGVDGILMSGFSEKILVTWLSLFFKLPVIWYEYGPLQTVFNKNLFLPKFLYEISHYIPQVILTITNHTKANLLKHTSIKSSQIEMIYPGTKLPKKRAQINEPIIGCISRLAPEKGQRLLVQTWPEVVKQVPRAQLVLAGDGPDKLHLEQLIADLNMHGSIKILGFVEDKAKFYQSLKVFAFAGQWPLEGFGLVLAEAMSYGLPVVVANTQPMAEVVGKAGIKVNMNSSQELVNAFVKLLTDDTFNQQKRRESYYYYKQHYQIETQVTLIYQIIRDSIYAYDQKRKQT